MKNEKTLVYAEEVDAAALERAKALASKALEVVQPFAKNLASSSKVRGILKSPDSFGSLKEVGAALDCAISRLAREYKQNNAVSRRKMANRYDLPELSLTDAMATGMRFEGSFSVTGEELSRKEVQGIAACMDGLLGEGGKGVIHNEAVGDMSLVAGRTGKRGMGLQHMAEHRLFQGFSLEEIGRIIAYALKAVESVESLGKHGTRLIFDRFGVRAVAATNPKMGNPVITGFVLDTNNERTRLIVTPPSSQITSTHLMN